MPNLTASRYVLVLEDDEATRHLLKEIIEQETGLAVREAGDAEHALDLLARVAELPCLLIVDLMLPGLDGETFMLAVRQRFGPDLPIMVVSALRQAEVEASARRAEAQAALAKPFDVAVLVAEVKKLVGEYAGGPAPIPEPIPLISRRPSSVTYAKVALPDEEPIFPRRLPTVPLQRPGASILVIEDDGPIAHLVRGLLSDAGYRAQLASNGDEAVKCAEEEQPDLMLLDLHLPDDDAVLIAARVRAACAPGLPIVVMSALPERPLAAMTGACAFIDKPFEVNSLLASIERALDSRHYDYRSLELHVRSDRLLARSQAVRAAAMSSLEWLRLTRQRTEVSAHRAAALLGESIEAAQAHAGGLFVRRHAQALQTIAAAGFPDDLVSIWQHIPAEAPIPAADAARGEEVWLCSPEAAADRYPEILSSLATVRPTAQALCAVPLAALDGPIGALGLLFPEPQTFGEEQRDRILNLGQTLAEALQA